MTYHFPMPDMYGQAEEGEEHCGAIDPLSGAVCTKARHMDGQKHVDASHWSLSIAWADTPKLLLPEDE